MVGMWSKQHIGIREQISIIRGKAYLERGLVVSDSQVAWTHNKKLCERETVKRKKEARSWNQISNNHKASFIFQAPCVVAHHVLSQLPRLPLRSLLSILPRCCPFSVIRSCQQSAMCFDTKTFSVQDPLLFVPNAACSGNT